MKGVISLTVSNWTTPGQFVCKKPALECTREEVGAEVWAQIKVNARRSTVKGVRLPSYSTTVLQAWLPNFNFTDDDLVTWTIDEGLSFRDGGNGVPLDNYSPLFINTPHSWPKRPQPNTEVENLFIGSDYAKAPQNVACMETANQASRIAVNVIPASQEIFCAMQSLLCYGLCYVPSVTCFVVDNTALCRYAVVVIVVVFFVLYSNTFFSLSHVF